MKLIHMSDLHLVKPGERLWGLNPFTRLEVALHDIARNHPDAELLVITGDLADQGEIEAYEGLRELLGRFPIRTVLLLGGHDNRENFYTVFPDAPRDPSGFAHFAEITHQGLFIFLDTVGEFAGPGILCEARQAWLAALLAEYRDVPVYLFAHHAPFDLGVPMIDQTRLANADHLAALLRHNAVHHLFFGHGHRASVCTWQGILCSGVPGIGYQFPLVEGSVTSAYSVEPPMYAVVRLEDYGTLINYDTYMHRHSADMRGYVPPPPPAAPVVAPAAETAFLFGAAQADPNAYYAAQTVVDTGDAAAFADYAEPHAAEPAAWDSAPLPEEALGQPVGELETGEDVAANEAVADGAYYTADEQPLMMEAAEDAAPYEAEAEAEANPAAASAHAEPESESVAENLAVEAEAHIQLPSGFAEETDASDITDPAIEPEAVADEAVADEAATDEVVIEETAELEEGVAADGEPVDETVEAAAEPDDQPESAAAAEAERPAARKPAKAKAKETEVVTG